MLLLVALLAMLAQRAARATRRQLLGVGDGGHLLRHHGQHGQRDAVELVEAAPHARLCQPAEDLGAVAVRLLARAVPHLVMVRGSKQVIEEGGSG